MLLLSEKVEDFEDEMCLSIDSKIFPHEGVLLEGSAILKM
jgi:hypothetical protein